MQTLPLCEKQASRDHDVGLIRAGLQDSACTACSESADKDIHVCADLAVL